MGESGKVDLSRVQVRLIRAEERAHWDELMRAHHSLGLVALVGRSLRYVAELDGRWLALLGWAGAAGLGWRSAQMRQPGHLDRLVADAAMAAPGFDRQQQPFLDPA